jgi:hypothetical protein
MLRAALYGLLRALGIAMAAYLALRAPTLMATGGRLFDFSVLILGSVALVVAAIANFAITYALTAGRVAAVRGTRETPELVAFDGLSTPTKALRLVANLDRNGHGKAAHLQVVIFLQGWKPGSCVASTFLPSREMG